MSIGPRDPLTVIGEVETICTAPDWNIKRQRYEDGNLYQLTIRVGSPVLKAIDGIPADAVWFSTFDPREYDTEDDNLYLNWWQAA